MWELTKSFRFEAAHALPGTTFGAASEEIHGHSFRAEVTVRGTPDPATGMVLDLGLLERSMTDVRKTLDHKLLNKVEALGPEVVRADPADLAVYAYDGYSEEGLPSAAVVPHDTRETAIAVRIAHELGEPVVPRGAGTGLCGGAIPARGPRRTLTTSGSGFFSVRT